MPALSIILPVYNCEEFLNRCIDSILAQSFTDFELITVNDGSTDRSSDILRGYKKKDSRIKIIEKKNKGVSAARNTGIKYAKGNYLMFCDSDDYVHPQWCEIIYNCIKKHKNSFVCCNYRRFTNSYEIKPPAEIPALHEDKITYYQLYKIGCSGGVWNKIFDADTVKNNNIQFDISVPIGEDALFNAKYLEHCCNVVLIDEPLYYYYQNSESAMRKYYPDWLKYHLDVFYCRVPFVEKEFLAEYCDGWLSVFIEMLNNIHDERNQMSLRRQLKYNQSMLKSKEFNCCIKHATCKKESKLIIRLLKIPSYYLYWLFVKAVKLRKRG